VWVSSFETSASTGDSTSTAPFSLRTAGCTATVLQPGWYKLGRSGRIERSQRAKVLQIAQITGCISTGWNIPCRTSNPPVAGSNPAGRASSNEGALVRIDPATNKVVGRTDIGCAYSGAATDDAVWVHHDCGESMGFVTRVEPAR
jgi:hypothetical protein